MAVADVDMAPHIQPVSEQASVSGVEYQLHPLVLINISDHYTRTFVAKGDTAGVIGCLLGQHKGRKVDISNSFEMLLGPDANEPVHAAVFEAKLDQYKQNFATLDIVGWYAIGAQVLERDLHIQKWIMEKMDTPILLRMDPTRSTPEAKDLPITIYESVMHVVEGTMQLQFVKASFSMETSDAERIGVNTVAHILPSGAGGADSALAQHYSGLHSALEMLAERVRVLIAFLKQMHEGKVPLDHKVLRMVSGLLHKLPAMDSDKFEAELMTEFSDSAMVTMMCMITKGVDACHDLVGKSHIAYDNFLKSSK